MCDAKNTVGYYATDQWEDDRSYFPHILDLYRNTNRSLLSRVARKKYQILPQVNSASLRMPCFVREWGPAVPAVCELPYP